MRLHEERELIRVRQPAVSYTQKSKLTNVHTCVSVNACVYEERERISVTLVTTAALKSVRVISACTRARVCVQVLFRTNLSHMGLFVCRCPPWHKNTHTQPALKTQVTSCQVMIENQHFHSSTVSQHSATTHTHTHSSDESPVKTSGGRSDNWLEDKPRCLYRGETESYATNWKVKYIHTQTHKLHAGMYDCMRSESESELGNHRSGILRKANKQTNVLLCLWMYMCKRSESESASHS